MKTITDAVYRPEGALAGGSRLHASGWPGRLLRITITLACVVALNLALTGCATKPGHRDAPRDLEAAPQRSEQVRRQPPRRGQDHEAWTRLSRQFAMPMPRHPSGRARIQRHVEFYLNNPHIISASLSRAEPWVEHLLDEFERRNLPGELFLVPLIESGFSARATSPSGAAGIWQFMPATGSHFGLRQTEHFDGRRDVFASTDAALEYFEALHRRFDDWALALAAFNYGQGNVARAMEANQRAGSPDDYWSLQLSDDAMSYVPRILALRLLIESRRIELPRHRPEHGVVGIPIDVALDLTRVAALAEVPLDDLRALNPGTRSTLLKPIPGARLAIPRSALPKLNQAQYSQNGRQRARDPIRTARQALATGAAAPAAQVSLNGAVSVAGASTAGQRIHVVQRGETLWGIAARHGVDLGELGELNALPRGATLSPGQSLSLPARPNGSGTQIVHRVQAGETLSAIARRYGVSLDAIRHANHIPGDLLRAGETLLIPRLR